MAAGAGDTAANALGAGIVEPGMVFDVAGTAAVLASCTDTFVADTKNRALLTMRSVIPGLWNPLAYIAGGGLALRWFRDQFYNASRGKTQPVAENAYEDLYREMIDLAAGVEPGSDRAVLLAPPGRQDLPGQPGDARRLDRGFLVAHAGALRPGAVGEHRLRIRLLSADSARAAAVAGADPGAGGGRRGAQPGLEPDQGRHSGRAVPAPAGQRIRHLGRGHDRREGGRV